MGPDLRQVRHLPRACCPIGGIQETRAVDLHVLRIRHIAEGIGEGHFDGFQLPGAGLGGILLRKNDACIMLKD